MMGLGSVSIGAGVGAQAARIDGTGGGRRTPSISGSGGLDLDYRLIGFGSLLVPIAVLGVIWLKVRSQSAIAAKRVG